MSGARVHARILSAAPPGAPTAVLAHGLEDSWEGWRPLAAQLPGFRLVALDLPWRPGNDYGWRQAPAGHWLGAGLDLLDGRPDLLVAHSFGANAALELLCAGEPRTGAGAVLICPLYRQPERPVTWRMLERARTTFIDNIRQGVRAKLGGRGETLADDVLGSMLDLAVERVGPAGFLAVFEQFEASARLPLEGIDLPTLMIAGGADPTLSRGAATALAGRIPGSRMLLEDAFDHFCHLRRPAEVAARIADFAGSLPRPASSVPGGPR